MKLPFFFFFLFLVLNSFSQEEKPILLKEIPQQFEYDDDLLPAAFFAKNRQAVRDRMPANSVAVFFANPVRNRSNDVDFEYHQDPNFYYLTGLREPNAVLVIYKDQQHFGDETSTKEILFLQKRNPKNEQWTGKRLGVDGALTYLQMETAIKSQNFAAFEAEFNTFDNIYVFKIPEDVAPSKEKDELYTLIKNFNLKTESASTKINNVLLGSILAELRQTKSKEEITLLRKAIDITCEAQIELMKSLKPGMKEYESEAIVEYFFKKNGAEYPGFPSILGSGENSCVLHYTTNRKILGDNDLLVSDIGAEYHGYTADVTRTIPAKGTFSKEQKIIYNIVLEAQQAGIDACLKGNKFWDPHQAATEIISNRLLELGIIDKKFNVRNYFMHGTSHYLGLDVHDVGLYGPLMPGQVITVEPGIYIPEGSDCDPKWWNIGVRIEDDILITNGKPEVLSAKAPRKIEEIEALMKEKGTLE
ncbi:MAG: aminopeptidase P N-terminal domain-containing protein [Vicingaceae bacterium]|nr:aminopeptidase P N-terminal domain-containing protein [Vicingaceae bacterium]